MGDPPSQWAGGRPQGAGDRVRVGGCQLLIPEVRRNRFLTRSIGGSACATRRARERDNEAHWFIVAAASIDETSYVRQSTYGLCPSNEIQQVIVRRHPPHAALTEGVFKAMFLTRIKIARGVL